MNTLVIVRGSPLPLCYGEQCLKTANPSLQLWRASPLQARRNKGRQAAPLPQGNNRPGTKGSMTYDPGERQDSEGENCFLTISLKEINGPSCDH